MRIAILVLLLAGVSIVLPILADDDPRAINAKATNTTTFPTAEHDGIVVTLIEESVSRSPDGKHTVTSFLFMVENRNENPGTRTIVSPLRFFSPEGELHRDSSNGVPKTGGKTIRYNKQDLPKFDELPEPANGSKTYLYRQWIQAGLPRNVIAVEAAFGQDGKTNSYRFPIRRR
ncbi:MAG: hypothetical protein CMJ57_02690 [Planctomycetaceae bacterium]|nr:hypothetical protein [Planctomycetaceae bacterium]